MGSFDSGFLDFLLSGSFITIFIAIIMVLIATGFVLMIVSLIRGKGKAKRYVLMEVDDDGTMRPVARTGPTVAHELHHGAHQQAMQQALLTQSLHQPGVNGPPPGA